MLTGAADRLGQSPLSGSPVDDSALQRSEHRRVPLIARVGLIVLEPPGEFLGVLNDVSDCAWHLHHLRNLSRACMAWTMTGRSVKRKLACESWL